MTDMRNHTDRSIRVRYFRCMSPALLMFNMLLIMSASFDSDHNVRRQLLLPRIIRRCWCAIDQCYTDVIVDNLLLSCAFH